MQLDAVTIDRNEARKAFLAYRDALRAPRRDEDAKRRAEDEAIMRAYREAAKGAALIRLSDTMSAGGLTTISWEDTRWEGGRQVAVTRTARVPCLSVARADVPFVYTQGVHDDGSWRVTMKPERDISYRNRRDVIEFPAGAFAEGRGDRHFRSAIRALVPAIPPALRPQHALANYHILWEAEWHIDRTIPPIDPALLKHLGGDLYAVLAVWDLTPLERAVLAGREA